MKLCSVISGSGSFIPPQIQTNADFARHVFYAASGEALDANATGIVDKLEKITGISERRYTADNETASDLGYEAARLAIEDSGINPETLDQIIVAHNFGNVVKHSVQSTAVPSLASLIKHRLQIRNPSCIAYDILFGCPGWLQGLIQADALIKSGQARRILVVGTETLSRVIDPYDRDSMIFSDGAGAVIIEGKTTRDSGPGILNYVSQTYAMEDVDYIHFGSSFYPGSDPHVRFLKMKGRKVYEFAISFVPPALKTCLEKSGVQIGEVKKIFLHQANEKMDEAIIKRLFQLFGIDEVPADILPMSIGWLGNSSVATVPTLFDLVRKNNMPPHQLHHGDIILFASIGAGMNINALCYRY
ncbi:MAG TPA: ketoacyl-ACP synthase III [Puia sp.]|nr:ketoacyl-ACP synthase III [Puia sp.]